MLFDALKIRAKAHPQKAAVVFNGEGIRYRRLLHRVQQLAHALYTEGVRAGDAVAVVTDNRPEYIEAFFALARLNVVMIPINTSYHAKEMVDIFDVCDVRWLICDKNYRELCGTVIDAAKRNATLFNIDPDTGDKLTFDTLITTHSSSVDISLELDKIPAASGDEDFIVLFSSGSTGRPKRMARSQASYLFEMEGFIKLTETTSDDRILCAIPLYHSHGIGSCLLPAFGAGALLVLLDQQSDGENSASPKELFAQKLGTVLDLIKREKVTIFPAIPYIYQAILDYPKAAKSQLRKLRHCFSSGNFLSPDLYKRFHQRFGIAIRQIYGCSEAGAVTIDAVGGFDDASPHLPAGVPLPGTEIKVVNQDGKECAAGKVGEVLIKSPSLTKGYIDHHDLNEQAFKGGYFHTGDMGRIDKQGVLTLTGRKKLLIDTGGKKVDPFEIQDVIAALPSVDEVIVLGVPATGGNEWIKAVVATTEKLDKEDVIEHCRQRLASYKVPRIVEFRESIPKSATGKVLRKDLVNEDDVAQITRQFLHELIEKSISSDAQLDADLTFDEMGIDSVVMTELNKALEEQYDFLPKTLFFEYRTLGELTEYLNTHHQEQLQSTVKPLIGQDDGGKGKGDTAAAKVNKSEAGRRSRGDIAIIGMAGQYPGATNLQAFWENLVAGKDCITEIPKERWDWRAFFDTDPDARGKSYSRWGGFIDGAYEFDTSIFAIPPVEAETIDPQERLFLAGVWRTLEDAGYTRDDFLSADNSGFNNVGVYVGVMWGDYQLFSMNRRDQMEEDGNLTKSHYWSIPNRVSYFFNFTGPSMAVDTACSSSLTAVHAACQAINSGECEWAIAGGVNLILHPRRYQLMSLGKFASTDGRCRSFGEGGDGYVPAEGVGSVLLKPLDDAVRDNDNIYAVIKGSALNHGGNSKAYTVPDPHAQKDVILKALDNAGVTPESVSYVEAHGTGTSLGDPIEIRGLSLAFERHGEAKSASCAIGSVKSNIGHAEAAAGVAGVAKVALQMRHKALVPSLHSQLPNPNIDFGKSPFYLQHECSPWQFADAPLRASLSSFGAGGSNVHVVFESHEMKPRAKEQGDEGEQLFVLSAMNRERLVAYARLWFDAIGGDDAATTFMGSSNPPAFGDVAYTLQIGRTGMPSRFAVIASGWKELKQALKAFVDETAAENLFVGEGASKRKSAVAAFVMPDEPTSLSALRMLAQQWVSGIDVPWKQIRDNSGRKRVSLPTYPFTPTSYAVPLPEFGEEANSEKAPVAASAPVSQRSVRQEKVLLSKAWRRAACETARADIAGAVVTLGTPRTHKIAEALFAGQAGIEIVHVVHNGADAENTLSIDCYRADEGESLYARLKERLGAKAIAGVIDLTALDERYERSAELELGKIRLLQKLVESERMGSLFLLQVTFRLTDHGTRSTTLQGARMAGLYRMLGAEYRQIKSLVMDTDCLPAHHHKLARQVEAEVSHLDSLTATECCYRKNDRYLPTLQQHPVAPQDGSRQGDGGQDSGRDDVVLITGGTGGLGLAVAGRLQERGVKKMVLLGREVLPDATEWQSAVTADPESRQARKLRALMKLTDKGADIHYANASLTDKAALKKLVKGVHKRFGAITGVYHCAGMASDTPVFFNKAINDIEAVCAPKIKGLVNLSEVLDLKSLRFFTLFSSISALIPSLGAGQSDYALANSYMDDFAAHMQGRGFDCFRSLQWSAWGETGLSASEESRTPLYGALGFEYLSNDAALELMDAATRQPKSVLSPCVIDADGFAPEHLLDAVSEVKTHSGETENDAVLHETVIVEGDTDVIKAWLFELFSEELKIPPEQMDGEQLFSDYGIESVLLAQLTQTIQKRLEVTLSPSLLLEYGSVNELADYFSAEHAALFNMQPTSSGVDEAENRAARAVEERTEPHSAEEDAIAVVGISCRLPGADNKELFWRNLLGGRSTITPVPEGRWKPQHNRVDYGGFVDGIEMFDPGFFKVNEKDAAVMDPQARLLLEESLSAICDAGYEPGDASGERVGVYIGGRAEAPVSFSSVLSAPNPILGVGQNYLATNVSRFFNFSGPSMVLDTACSSGLMALQLASDALKSGRIDSALVGAASLLVNSHAHDVFAARNILSTDGKFHIFDKQSGGEVLGEGVAVVMLKRLKEAVADGNKIYGVVRAIAINNDGQTLGPGSPNIKAQKAVMEQALSMANIAPEEVGYIEVNGGGSPVVDSVEIRALSEVYQLADETAASCCIGSIKPNVGHLLLSSGMASFIRCVLSVYHKQVPPYLSTREPFDFYDFSRSRIEMNRSMVAWETNARKPRIAAQNCFPDGGTNCHVLVEEYLPTEAYTQRHFGKPVPALNRRRFPMEREEKESDAPATSRVKAVRFENVWGQYEESI